MKRQKGFSLVEVLLSIALFAVFVSGIVGGLIYIQESTRINGERLQGLLLIEESIEAITSIRDENFAAIADGTYGLNYTSGQWELAVDPDIVGAYTRTIIVTSISDSVKQIDATIEWNMRPNQLGSINTTYQLTDWTVSSETEGGTLGGYANWCEPNLAFVSIDLPKNGTANSISAIEGRIIAGTGDNASGVSVADISITTNENPPTPTLVGTVDGYKTNDVFFDGSYIYVATDTNSSEVVILDLNTYAEVGYFDSPGVVNGSAVFVKDDYGYLIQGDRFRVFDLSSKVGSRSMVSNDKLLGGNGTDLYVLGDYAYITLSGGTSELEVIDISNPSNPTSVGSADVSAEDGVGIFINPFGTRAYLATAESSTEDEFFILDITDKSASPMPLLGSYDTNGMDPKGVRVFPGKIGVIVGHGGEEYQVLNITSEQSIAYCGGVDIDSGINAIDALVESDNDAYAYVVTKDSDSELKIVEGGADSEEGGGGGGGVNGDYTSLILRRD